MRIDCERLRKDLISYFGTAVASGISMAIVELSKVERSMDVELIEIAQKNGFCLETYDIDNKVIIKEYTKWKKN